MDVAKLVVEVSTKGAKETTNDIEKIGKSAGTTEKSVATLSKGMSGLSGVLSAMAIGTLIKEFSKISDTMTLMEARIKLVSTATDNYKSIQSDLLKVANEGRVSIKEMGELYARLSPALRTLGASTNNIIDVTSAFSKSLLVSGASAAEANGAIRQFSQAMASGVLRGEEFNSLMENSPRAMKALTETLGKTQGELRKMAENGELASGIVAGALLRSLTKLEAEASAIPKTIGGEFEKFGNQVSITVQKVNEATDANLKLANGVTFLTTTIEKATDAFIEHYKYIDEFVKKNGTSIAVMEEINNVAGTIVEKQEKFKNLFEQKPVTDFDEALKGVNSSLITFEKIATSPKISLAPTLEKMRSDAATTIENISKEEQARKKEEAERKKAEDKAQKDAQKLAEEWAVKKREITASMAIAEQDELAKPFIILNQKYQEDLIKFKGTQEAKALLTSEFNAEYQRLALDATNKVEEERLKVIEKTRSQNEKTIQKELKLQEENFRIQERQVALLDDEADREVATATLQYQRTQASLSAQLKMGEVSETYYDAMMNAEEKLLEKQKQNWTVYGQIINNTTAGMENSFMGFFDATNDGYMKLGELGKSIMRELYQEALRVALIKPLVGALTSAAMSGLSGMFSTTSATTLPNASTSTAFTGSEPLQFAHGGTPTGLGSYSNQVVSKPTYFAFASGGVPNGGLMGEAGSEAIMPLTRTSNGDLGVSMVGGGGSNVTINIENQTGMNLDLKQLTKSQDDKGNEIRTYVMKFASSDPEFRTALGLSR